MFYENVLKLCNNKGISLTSLLHDELHMSTGNITRWKGGTTPNGETLSKIASYFGVTVDYLLGNDQKEKPLVNGDKELTAYLDMLRTRPEMRMLFDITKDATKADVEKAVQIIEAYLKK